MKIGRFSTGDLNLEDEHYDEISISLLNVTPEELGKVVAAIKEVSGMQVKAGRDPDATYEGSEDEDVDGDEDDSEDEPDEDGEEDEDGPEPVTKEYNKSEKACILEAVGKLKMPTELGITKRIHGDSYQPVDRSRVKKTLTVLVDEGSLEKRKSGKGFYYVLGAGD